MSYIQDKIKQICGEFIPTFADLTKVMALIHDEKDAKYSGEILYSNFRNSEKLGIKPHIGAMNRQLDKIERLCRMLRAEIEGNPIFDDAEPIEDSIIDAMNYLGIVFQLRDEFLTGLTPEEYRAMLVKQREERERLAASFTKKALEDLRT